MQTSTRTLLALSLAILLVGCTRKEGESETSATPPESVPPEVVLPESAGTPSAAAPESAAIAAVPLPVDPLLTVAQNKAAGIDAGISSYTMRSQPQVFGDVRSDISMYSIGPQVVLIEEKLATSDNSTSTNRYYFDAGVLFLYQDEGRWLDVNPPSPLITKSVKRSVAFTPAGKLLTASKTVDDIPVALGEYEAVAILARAQQLLGPLPPAAAVTAPAAETAAATATVMPQATTPSDAEAKPAAVEPPVAEAKPAAEQPAEEAANRIRFGAGKATTQVKGTLPASGTRDFVVRAKAGQLLTLSLEGAATAVFGVYSSRGEIVTDLTNWSSKLPRDGDYTIKVGQAKGATTSGDFVMTVTLE
jgi:hypothetical protein